MGAVWTIVRKDLVLRSRDRSIFLYGIVAPLVIGAVLGVVFGGLDEGLTLDVAVVTGEGPLGAVLVDDVLPVLTDDGLVTSFELLPDRAAATTAVEAGTVDAAFIVTGPGGEGLEVLGSVDAPTLAGVTEAIAQRVVDDVAFIQDVVAAGSRAGVADIDALVRAGATAAPAYVVAAESVGVRPLDSTTYVAAGMAVFFLLFAVGIAVTGMLEEERDGTLARLRTAPVAAWAPLAAKGVTAVIVGCVAIGSLAIATTLLLGARWGSPLALAPLVLAAVLAATGLVGLVASLARTPESASSIQAIVGTVLGALGGAFFPIAGGGVLAVLGGLTPHRWFLRGLTDVAGGAPFGDVVGDIGALLAIALLTGGAAAVIFRRRWEA